MVKRKEISDSENVVWNLSQKKYPVIVYGGHTFQLRRYKGIAKNVKVYYCRKNRKKPSECNVSILVETVMQENGSETMVYRISTNNKKDCTHQNDFGDHVVPLDQVPILDTSDTSEEDGPDETQALVGLKRKRRKIEHQESENRIAYVYPPIGLDGQEGNLFFDLENERAMKRFNDPDGGDFIESCHFGMNQAKFDPKPILVSRSLVKMDIIRRFCEPRVYELCLSTRFRLPVIIPKNCSEGEKQVHVSLRAFGKEIMKPDAFEYYSEEGDNHFDFIPNTSPSSADDDDSGGGDDDTQYDNNLFSPLLNGEQLNENDGGGISPFGSLSADEFDIFDAPLCFYDIAQNKYDEVKKSFEENPGLILAEDMFGFSAIDVSKYYHGVSEITEFLETVKQDYVKDTKKFALLSTSLHSIFRIGVILLLLVAVLFSLAWIGMTYLPTKTYVLNRLSEDGMFLENYARFQDDESCVLAALKENCDAFEFASERLRNRSEVILEALWSDNPQRCWASFKFVSDFQKDNKSLVLLALTKSPTDMTRYISERLQDDKDVALMSVTKFGHSLNRFSRRMRNDFDVAVAATEEYSTSISMVGEELMDDKTFVLWALPKWGYGLEYVSDRLKDDFDVVEKAVSVCGECIAHASPRLQKDPKLLIDAARMDECVLHDGSGYHYGGVEKPIYDKSVIVNAFTANWSTGHAFYPSFDGHMLCLRELAGENNNEECWFESEDLRNVTQFARWMLLMRPQCLQFVDYRFRNDKELVKTLLLQNPWLLEFASERLRKDPEVVHVAIDENPFAVRNAHDDLLGNKEFMKEVLMKKCDTLMYASKIVRKDPEMLQLRRELGCEGKMGWWSKWENDYDDDEFDTVYNVGTNQT